MNSRKKGKNGELELARILREHGYEARRGQQYSGANGDADVIGLPGIHIECKRVERLNISDAMTQSMADARQGEMPAVFHRKNCEPWKVTMLLEDWLRLYGNQKEKWIWCSERMPEESLNSVIGWDLYRERCCFVQYYDGRWVLGNDEPVDIIAWMPLPTPPEGEP